MFLYNKPYEVSGAVYYENYNTGTAQLSSGLKIVKSTSTAYLTGTVRFRIAKRDKRIISSKEGRTSVNIIVAQFGWDEIKKLNQKDIYLDVGKFKIEYDGIFYRLTDKNDFGQDIDRVFNNIGIIEGILEKERPNL